MVLRPEKSDVARAIFEKWELDFSVIGKITDRQRLSVRRDGALAADVAIAPLVENAPVYDRDWASVPPPSKLAPPPPPEDVNRCLLQLMGGPDLCSKRWIWQQYDSMVMADTVQGPGGDAAVVRVHGSNKGLALTTDCTPRYCSADPETGGAQAVAEAFRNLVAVGARPLAITDCLNFGNPERPEVMGQFVGCIRGMVRACQALDLPVVSGNVSFYNETNGRAIHPTPMIGAVGVIADLDHMKTLAIKGDGDVLLLIGETHGNLGASLYARDIARAESAAPPPIDLAMERRVGDLVRQLIDRDLINACHDVSDGGLYVALAEMALAGNLGVTLDVPSAPAAHVWLFAEDQARFVVAATAASARDVLAAASDFNIPAREIGRAGGDALTVSGTRPISLSMLRQAHEAWLPRYMDEG